MNYILFHPVAYQRPEDARYQHQMLALAEGLRSLKVPYGSDRPYWAGPDRAFTLEHTVPKDGPTLHVYSNEGFAELRSNLSPGTIPAGQSRVYLDGSDGWRTEIDQASFPSFSRIFRSHSNDRYVYDKKVRPWAFGLTERIIESLKHTVPWERRADKILFNFRAAHPLRSLIGKKVLPRLDRRFSADGRIDSKPPESDRLAAAYWASTGRRHYPEYYARLLSTKLCAAFGGYFSPGLCRNVNNPIERLAYKTVFNLGLRTGTIMQWDSWRLWEAWAAGCVVLHVDFDRYGCRFPVQPVNWKQYIGFDLNHIDRDAERLLSLGDQELAAIGEAGRTWAMEHYSPLATARRFLDWTEDLI